MRLLCLAASLLLATSVAEASIRVAPVLLDVHAPGVASTLTLKNDDSRTIPVQIRIFRWSQTNGEERLEPTQDVVVSPPFSSLSPGTEYVVRVVRVARRPVTQEESYRVVVDEIPDRPAVRSGVRFALRYSIPVFFAPSSTTEARVVWSAQKIGSRLLISAQNSGTRRMRISNLQFVDQRGRTVALQEGLAGYVLERSAMRWEFTRTGAPRDGEKIRLIAETDTRPIDATVILGPAR